MTTANGGTYAGQYSCDIWVDNLEPTFLILYVELQVGVHARTAPNSTVNLQPANKKQRHMMRATDL